MPWLSGGELVGVWRYILLQNSILYIADGSQSLALIEI